MGHALTESFKCRTGYCVPVMMTEAVRSTTVCCAYDEKQPLKLRTLALSIGNLPLLRRRNLRPSPDRSVPPATVEIHGVNDSGPRQQDYQGFKENVMRQPREASLFDPASGSN